ncbi:hypothetical protein [Burkholderia sp. Ac-20353]|uniref:hypothetical protein n=1 Tax=Burkholderia sp. Ac-20353 TaxID=2703894 RepID=UPI00197B1741|nr:hypothetical protein [Burkholderia sp. Ac-20353]MBN3789481.1 hypothetical protein [Burkholderia sp. Ac-20353]
MLAISTRNPGAQARDGRCDALRSVTLLAAQTDFSEADAPYRSRHDFICETSSVDGSWWTCWRDWLRERSTGNAPARGPEAGLGPAPGADLLET